IMRWARCGFTFRQAGSWNGSPSSKTSLLMHSAPYVWPPACLRGHPHGASGLPLLHTQDAELLEPVESVAFRMSTEPELLDVPARQIVALLQRTQRRVQQQREYQLLRAAHQRPNPSQPCDRDPMCGSFC